MQILGLLGEASGLGMSEAWIRLLSTGLYVTLTLIPPTIL